MWFANIPQQCLGCSFISLVLDSLVQFFERSYSDSLEEVVKLDIQSILEGVSAAFFVHFFCVVSVYGSHLALPQMFPSLMLESRPFH